MNTWGPATQLSPVLDDQIIIDLLQKGISYSSSRPLFLTFLLPCLRASPSPPNPISKAAGITWLGPFLNLSAQPPSAGSSVSVACVCTLHCGHVVGVACSRPQPEQFQLQGLHPDPWPQDSKAAPISMEGTDQLSEETPDTTT